MSETEMTAGRQFIAGRRVASGEATLLSLKAADGEATGHRFYPASREEAALAAQAAAQAFAAYSGTSPETRARFLETIADELDGLGESFFAIAHAETALPLARLQGERARTSGQLRMFAGLLRRGDVLGARIDTALPARQPLPRADLRQYQVALGPVAVFGASNFPLAFSTAGGDTASALAAGCPVVVKAHPGHMATAEQTAQAIVRAVEKCALPGGVFNMIFGTDIGAELVRHPAIQAVGFTGSLTGGKALLQLAQQRPQPIPLFAEMSAINPLIILPQALAARAASLAKDLVASFTLGGGQFCTRPGLILALKGEGLTRFTAALCEQVQVAPAQVLLNAPTLQHYRAGVETLDACPGVQRLASGEAAGGQRAQALLYLATAEAFMAPDSVLQTEVFGPLSVLVEVADETQMMALVSTLQGQLTATLHADADDRPLAARLLPLLSDKAGRVLFNGYPTGVEVCDAMVHGGPWPATTDARGTSVGTRAIERFLRPVCLQNAPAALLPPALQDANPLNLLRLVNGQWTREAISPSC
ncbi:aldehyde dehydrogenase (NADP(+)) [Raoultella ornithinolytica]|uniref:aldehyde dehydrogenase (NADP(+)) n=1 Tax=Raoultella ornithinolytica TaxID=54291 RepID=UPI000CF3572A|nr:aldehyde dehydrogenase (NADP(+)) [Raoultella ornithinolytica]AYW53247.1 aldehyde dehydrogenase (NADP(+)) [Raoultella ornithinolytica]EKV0507837.1 aldehyde dehydrogenase (NADP(+)) [Raoultella ornithinolytica]ELB6486971.1 aldehyde dehydrogenase (NADP(+)) [Raoultella ornithinolytica]EMF1902329.1 aldehyde dehydrogenase (NADP(+)) [Raoultella ornithinolytica]MCT4740935.1 aldehyde dehydrogenase (NADP(+)) [Raoultella ornithinolytica]